MEKLCEIRSDENTSVPLHIAYQEMIKLLLSEEMTKDKVWSA